MGRLMAKLKKDLSDPVPKSSVIFLVIAGVFLGTVFTFGTHYWKSEVTKDEAIRVEAIFSSYDAYRKQIIVRFTDHELLDIKGTRYDKEIVNTLESIKPGSKLQMYVHPNSNTILELVYNGDVLIDFDNTVHKLSSEIPGFMFLGIFMYISAAFGAIKLIRREVF